LTNMYRKCKRCKQSQTMYIHKRSNGGQRMYWLYNTNYAQNAKKSN
jgi:hypothetical protein